MESVTRSVKTHKFDKSRCMCPDKDKDGHNDLSKACHVESYNYAAYMANVAAYNAATFPDNPELFIPQCISISEYKISLLRRRRSFSPDQAEAAVFGGGGGGGGGGGFG